MLEDKPPHMADGLRGCGAALVLTVGVAIEIGGQVLEVCLQLACGIQCGPSMVQVGYTYGMREIIPCNSAAYSTSKITVYPHCLLPLPCNRVLRTDFYLKCGRILTA